MAYVGEMLLDDGQAVLLEVAGERPGGVQRVSRGGTAAGVAAETLQQAIAVARGSTEAHFTVNRQWSNGDGSDGRWGSGVSWGVESRQGELLDVGWVLPHDLVTGRDLLEFRVHPTWDAHADGPLGNVRAMAHASGTTAAVLQDDSDGPVHSRCEPSWALCRSL